MTVLPVVDMRLRCRTNGKDYPPGIPPDISKVLELDIVRHELNINTMMNFLRMFLVKEI